MNRSMNPTDRTTGRESEAASAPSLTLTVETVGEDVLIRFSGSRSDVVMVPAGFLPDFVKALQEILHEKQEVASW